MDELVVITYSDKTNNYEKNLITLLHKYNYNYEIVGKKIKWEGYLSKFPVYISSLQELKYNKLVIICDCYDVLVQNTPEEAVNRYNQLRNQYGDIIVVGTEDIIEIGVTGHELNNYWSSKLNLCNNRPNDQYLNSGFIMGRAEDILNFYQEGFNKLKDLPTTINNDQVPLSLVIEENPKKFHLDTSSTLISTIMLNDINDRFTIRNNKVLDTESNNEPIFIHIPFCSKDSYKRYNSILNSSC